MALTFRSMRAELNGLLTHERVLALLAAFPVWRASRVDPVNVLRQM